MSVALITSIDQIGHNVARALVRVSVRNETVRISTPVLFPSGSCIGIEIARHRDGFIVSDMGGAAVEAEMLGGARQFARLAEDVAGRFGVRFDRHMIFDIAVPEDELTVAVMAVANAAKSAVEATMLQIAAPGPIDTRGILWTRLDAIFDGGKVHRNVRIKGASDTWDFDAVVETGRHRALFEVVVPHANSVASAVTKFLDIRDLGADAPVRIAALTARSRTSHLAVLAKTAKIIDTDSSPDAFRDAVATFGNAA